MGGDFDDGGPYPNALLNQDAIDNGQAAVYVPFAVPPNQTWTVAGLFSNNMSTASIIDPPEVQWSISTGVSQGNAGTVIASGKTKASFTATGRSWEGMNEYTALTLLNAGSTFTLSPGHYWMSVVPICTFVGERAPCGGAYYYMSDVEDVPPPHAKGFESTDESYWNVPGSSIYNFLETGGPNGLCSQLGGGGGCDKFSAGLLGTAVAQDAQQPTPPPYCKPCLFYGGDFDASSPLANALTNNLVYEDFPAATYVPFFVPTGQTWTVTGLFSNNMSNTSFLDPPDLKWSISSGVSAGNPGTIFAQGTIHATLTATGRSWNGMTEYTALGHLTPQTIVTLTQSGVYWMTAVPVCTDPSCGHAHFYLSDVEDVPAPNHKGDPAW